MKTFKAVTKVEFGCIWTGLLASPFPYKCDWQEIYGLLDHSLGSRRHLFVLQWVLRSALRVPIAIKEAQHHPQLSTLGNLLLSQ